MLTCSAPLALTRSKRTVLHPIRRSRGSLSRAASSPPTSSLPAAFVSDSPDTTRSPGEERGHQGLSPDADLLLDGTLNHPKSYSIAALLHPELAAEFEALQDRLRERILLTWQRELNARRRHGGLIREEITRIEVVELQHRRSRALDPHIHRHLRLNIKVRSADHRWSNLDSRVAMKLHTVVNAGGELVACTDTAWIAALARHGYTLDDTVEIAELACAVRSVSHRSAQIETNRARLIAESSAAHGGDLLRVWRCCSRSIGALGRYRVRTSRPISMRRRGRRASATRSQRSIRVRPARAHPFLAATDPHAVDLDLLAARQSTRANGPPHARTVQHLRIRAGAIRALSRTGVVAERNRLDGAIADITVRATRPVCRLVADDPPAHVKAFMATATVLFTRGQRGFLPRSQNLFACCAEVRHLRVDTRSFDVARQWSAPRSLPFQRPANGLARFLGFAFPARLGALPPHLLAYRLHTFDRRDW